MEQSVPFVTIIVPCRNEKAHIETCVKNILAQQIPPGGFELLIADGMSDDGTRGILKKLTEENSHLQVIDNPGRFVSTGLNNAIQIAKGRVIIRMDAHTEYASDYVRECVAVLGETGADNVGGAARTRASGFIQMAVAAAYHSSFAVGGARFHRENFEGFVDTVPYGCWPREVFERIGLFDEELVRNQDDELNLRLTRAGGKIWQSPRIKSWYRPRASLGALFKQYMQYGYWKVRVIQKHKLPASIRHLIPGGFVAMFILLPFLSFWWKEAGWAWIGFTGTYLVASLTASFLVARRKGWHLFPLLPCVFFIYHFGYGYGFLRGVWDFLVWRGGPNRTCTELTRSSKYP